VTDQEETIEKETEEETKKTEDQTKTIEEETTTEDHNKTDNKEKDLKESKSRLLKPHSPYSSET